MLKFLSLNSSAAALQGTQLHRATGSTCAYLWQKADDKSCEPTNHNPSVIKQSKNGTWHGAEETRAIQAAAGYCSNLAFPTARELQANSSWSGIFPKALSLLLEFSNQLQLRDCFLLAWSHSASSTLLLSGWQPRQKIQDIQGKRMVWKVVDPWGIVTSPNGSKQLCCALLLQISIKVNTEMTTDNINTVLVVTQRAGYLALGHQRCYRAEEHVASPCSI